jgi:hypothetical protein
MQFISPSPLPTGNGSLNPARIDGDFYDDELPPELFDREEDMEDLNAFMHVAGLPDETF